MKNKDTGKAVFSMDKTLDACHVETLKECIPKHGQTIEKVCKTFKVNALEDLTFSQFDCLMQKMGEK